MSSLYEKLKEQITQEHGVALATVLRGPVQIGAKLLIYPDQTTHGTLGSEELERLVCADAVEAIWHGTAQIHSYQLPQLTQPATATSDLAPQYVDVFIEGFPPPPELIIVGAGHIAIPLTTIARTLNYRVTVIDARAAFATPERFPHASELIVAWPDEVLQQRTLYPSTAVAVLTHDPKFDEPTLKVLLKRSTGYVGAIGSHQTILERNARLSQQGLTSAQLSRIHGPIGLDIGASSPAEIALAIMAEIVAARHARA